VAKRKINILTVCGVGSGSSLILRMYTEDVLEQLGIPLQDLGRSGKRGPGH